MYYKKELLFVHKNCYTFNCSGPTERPISHKGYGVFSDFISFDASPGIHRVQNLKYMWKENVFLLNFFVI